MGDYTDDGPWVLDNHLIENYTVLPVKLRITSEGTDETPWILDGYDPASGDYTREVWDFAEWKDAVAAMPRFVEYTRRDGVRWPWDPEVSEPAT